MSLWADFALLRPWWLAAPPLIAALALWRGRPDHNRRPGLAPGPLAACRETRWRPRRRGRGCAGCGGTRSVHHGDGGAKARRHRRAR